jgi:hypothetical protein
MHVLLSRVANNLVRLLINKALNDETPPRVHEICAGALKTIDFESRRYVALT